MCKHLSIQQINDTMRKGEVLTDNAVHTQSLQLANEYPGASPVFNPASSFTSTASQLLPLRKKNERQRRKEESRPAALTCYCSLKRHVRRLYSTRTWTTRSVALTRLPLYTEQPLNTRFYFINTFGSFGDHGSKQQHSVKHVRWSTEEKITCVCVCV